MKHADSDYFSPTTGTVSLEAMIKGVSEFVADDPGAFYRLVIGTDSQTRHINGQAEIDFVTAIVIHRTGKGGHPTQAASAAHREGHRENDRNPTASGC